MRIKLVCILIGWCFVQVVLAHSDDSVSVRTDQRYIGYRKVPTPEGQIHPLKAPMGLISSDSSTVGRAMKNVLSGTGYLLAQPSASDPQILELLEARLPLQQRNLQQLTVVEALRILAGEPWQLTLDPVHRLVSFELPLGYKRNPVTPKLREPNNDMVFLGFTDGKEEAKEEAGPDVPDHLYSNCVVITRDLTVDWVKRRYWCYPNSSENAGTCHD